MRELFAGPREFGFGLVFLDALVEESPTRWEECLLALAWVDVVETLTPVGLIFGDTLEALLPRGMLLESREGVSPIGAELIERAEGSVSVFPENFTNRPELVGDKLGMGNTLLRVGKG